MSSVFLDLSTSLVPQLTFLPTDSVMGATGSGKSTVCFFHYGNFAVPSRKLIVYISGLHSSSTSSVDPTLELAESYGLVQTPYKWHHLLISMAVV